MSPKITQPHLYSLAFCFFLAIPSFAQNPGQIIKPGSPTPTSVVMNPHQDWYVTKYPDYVPTAGGHAGFDTSVPNYNCINQFEFSMYGIPEIGSGDVLNDNIGNACGITDLIPDSKGYSVYAVRDANQNLICRFRVGSYNSSVEAYSILIDADQKFGRLGDPGVTAATYDPNATAGNPGFELDITLINNSNGNSGGVFVYDIDGIDSCPTPIKSYSWDTNVQIAVADSHTCGDPDYFFDYFVSLADVISLYNANTAHSAISYTSPLRYAAVTNQNAGCSMQGKISDISGVDNSTATYTTSSSTGIYNSFLALVNNQCGTPLNDLLAGAGGFDKNVVTKPNIDPVNILQTVISGTTVESGIYIKVEVFPQTSPTTWASTPIETEEVTEASGVTNWSVTLTRPLAGFDLVVATTQKDKFTVPCANNGANNSSSTAVVVTCLLEATLNPTNVSCNGAANGSIAAVVAASPNNGTSPYTYSWNTSPIQTAATAINLLPGTYALTLKDANGCKAILNPVTITQPTAMTATVASTNVTCNGANDGTITVSSPAGGYGTYEYSINGGANWQLSGAFTSLANSTYNVQIRDAAHTTCVVDLDGAGNTIITQPSVLSGTVTSTNVTCNGASDGTITISASSGGYGTFEYSVNGGIGWQSSSSFTGLPNGNYNVLIRDAAHHSCLKDLDGSGNTTITQPNALSATLAFTNISTLGASDGTITISSPSGGYGSYQYSINGGTTWQSSGTYTGLPIGTYDVRIRDSAHPLCSIDLDGATNTTLIQPSSPITATVAKTNVTCNGANDGTITINSAAGGYGTYQYSIDGSTWQSSSSFTNLPNGSYNVKIRDAAYPTDVVDLDGSGNTNITQPTVLSATVSSTNVTVFGANNGTITITSPSGGYGTYEYSIDGGGSWQSSGSFTGLAGGSHNVYIRDAAHTTCLVDLDGSINTTIQQPTAPLTATVATTNVTCNGASNGAISITSPLGGYGTYEYNINGTWQSSGSFTGLASGTYNVQIRDAAYPTDVVDLDGTSNSTISQPAILSATVSSTNVTSNGANDGTITITFPCGGLGTYVFIIYGGSGWQSSGSFTGLSNNTYNVFIRDAAHTTCFIDLDGAGNTIITQPAVLNGVVSVTNVTCNGSSNGAITITSPTGGYGTYEYSINGGGSWLSSGAFNGLANGTYDVQIRDAAHPADLKDLDGSGNTSISQPIVLSATIVTTNVTLNGAGDGKITISSPGGGFGTYDYSIDGGITWQSSGLYTGLTNGTYNVLIRDGAHASCIIDLDGTVNTIITQPATLHGTIAVTNVTCNGANDGTINVTGVSGASLGNYDYTIDGWLTFQTNNGSFTNLQNKTYDVRIRDANATTNKEDLDGSVGTIISQPVVLHATITTTNVTKFGVTDATITISSPTGGSGGYEYNIGSGWQSSGSFTGLAGGTTYNVRIRDAANTSCIVDLDGAGDTPISTPGAALSATVTPTNVTCFGASTGTITVTGAAGGYGSFEYSKDGGLTWQSSATFSGLPIGTYNIQIRDAAQHTDVLDLDGSGNTVITQLAVLSATIAVTNVSTTGGSDGVITINGATGGSGTFKYDINGGAYQGTNSFTGLSAGSYDIHIQDASNTSCTIDLDGTVNTPVIQPTNPITASIAVTNATCFGASDGTISITSASGGYGTYQYRIDAGSWGSTSTFSLPSGTYSAQIRDAAYNADVVDLDGLTNTTISQPVVLSGTISVTNVTSNGASDGKITISTPLGGSGNYQYSINGGSSWQSSGSFTNLPPATTYNVFIRDASRTTCFIDLDGGGTTTTVTQPAALTATVTVTNVSCNGSSDGKIVITGASGGYGTFEYSINSGANWFSSGAFSNLPIGTSSYNVLIRDAAHVTDVVDLDGGSNTSITQPPILSATVSSTNVTSFGAHDGTINITSPSGGYGTYEYSSDGGGSWQLTGSFTGLVPATTYNLQIRDKAHIGCVMDLDGSTNTTIAQPAVLNASVSSTNVTCFGVNDGTITISSPSGGYGTYQYTIDGGTNWQSSGAFTGLANSTLYDVQIRDAAFHTDVLDLDGVGNTTTISQPAILAGSISSTNVSAFGGSDGTITVSSATGGSGNYQYSDDGTLWQSSGLFTGLQFGTYSVQIRDEAHTSCVIDLDGSINTPLIQPSSPITATLASSNVTCNGGNDGSITITLPAGGYGTFEYSINNGIDWYSTGAFTGLISGNYNVLIRDAVYTADVVDLDGANSTTTISQPDILSAIVTFTNVTAFNAHDGSITISFPIGGFGTYDFSNDAGLHWQSTDTFTGLVNNNYNVYIRDAAHTTCIVDLDGSSNTPIIQPSGPLSASLLTTNITCNGANDATITISSPSGGYGTYEYTINGGTSWQTTSTYTSLPNNTYDVQIRDAASTSDVLDLDGSTNTIFTQPGPLSATLSSRNVSSIGANDGTITVSSVSGGYGTYDYTIDGGTNWLASGTLTGLSNTTYNVIIRDHANTGCFIDLDGTVNTVIIQPTNPLSATVTSTNVTCYGANDGTITVSSAAGGYGTYQYSIDGGTTWQTSGSFTGLSGNNYNVQIRDADYTADVLDLDATLNTTILQPTSALGASVANTDVTCNGASDGTITVSSASGGYGTYEYSIDGGTTWQSSGSFTGLPNAIYNVIMRDATSKSCTLDLDGATNTMIVQPNPLTATITYTDVTSNNANDGTITVGSTSGGSGTYEYSIDGGVHWQSSGSFTNLPNATYDVQIRDAGHITCTKDLDGSANTIITQPNPLTATLTSTSVSCNAANDGTITISSPAGGYGTYEYSIDGGTTWHSLGSFTGLSNSNYNVQIRDAAHPTDVLDLDGVVNTVITQPIALGATVASTNPVCNGPDNNGAITITATVGGYGTYEYSIDGGLSWQTTSNYTGLGIATYNVQVRDAAHSSCVADLDGSVNTVLTGPAALSGTSVVKNIGCDAMNAGAIDLSVSGGTSPYAYSWSNGSAAEDISNLTQATYSVTVTDFNHCVLNLSYDVILECLFRVYQGVSPNGDGKNDYWRIDKIEEYPGNTVRIFDRFNNLVYETHGYSNETNNWAGQSNHGVARGILPEDTYFYWVDLGSGSGTYSGYVVLKNH